ncbi:MAG: pilin [Patescibacteria group bacterium]
MFLPQKIFIFKTWTIFSIFFLFLLLPLSLVEAAEECRCYLTSPYFHDDRDRCLTDCAITCRDLGPEWAREAGVEGASAIQFLPTCESFDRQWQCQCFIRQPGIEISACEDYCESMGLTYLTKEEETEIPPTEEELFPTYKIKSPIGEVTGPELIGRIIKTILGVVGALALAMFVFGGFTWLTSGGSPDKIKKGKDILMWAVIGLIIIFTSYTLVDFILTAFGL